MYFVVQSNTFKEVHHQLLIDTIQRFGFDHEIVDVIPFSTDFEYKTDRKDVICMGSVTMAHIAKKYGWHPGSFYNENHDFEVYDKFYGEHCLNHGAHVMYMGDEPPADFEYFFAKPCRDSKVFTGKLFSRKEWYEEAGRLLGNGHTTIEYKNKKVIETRAISRETRVLLCSEKTIYKEVRTWILDGKVIGWSQYKLGDQVIYDRVVDDDILEYAQQMADIYQPAKGFVLDVARTDDGLKIVEINCLNCAGFYHVNIQKLLYELNTAEYS